MKRENLIGAAILMGARTKEEPTVNLGAHLTHEESVERAVAALRGSQHHLLLTLTDVDDNRVTGVMSMYGNTANLIDTLVDYMDEHPELSLLFKLVQLQKMLCHGE